MTTVDYSKNDFIDINNQLFRRARNNIGESTAEDIKVDDLSNNEEVKIYGSELINNLKQINYTFEQLEAYVLMPSKLTKENAPKVKQNPDTKMIDLVDVSKLPEPPSVLPKKKRKTLGENPSFTISKPLRKNPNAIPHAVPVIHSF
jgi:hypothetical protein